MVSKFYSNPTSRIPLDVRLISASFYSNPTSRIPLDVQLYSGTSGFSNTILESQISLLESGLYSLRTETYIRLYCMSKTCTAMIHLFDIE
jgi:hypothetical protein